MSVRCSLELCACRELDAYTTGDNLWHLTGTVPPKWALPSQLQILRLSLYCNGVAGKVYDWVLPSTLKSFHIYCVNVSGMVG